ncbi:uracil-DNA glycosylase, partial [Candidatus Aerophobetes bacterium]|nr:uracil-DNA glycosylase [Candidatus Aerophobetes bacterium]
VLIPTYHPAACIYRPPWKKEFLLDLNKIKKELERVN